MNSENYQIFGNQLYREWQKQKQMNILKKFRKNHAKTEGKYSECLIISSRDGMQLYFI